MPPRTRKCGAEGCAERIKFSRYFCSKHFMMLPADMRAEVMEARRGYGMGSRLLPWLEQARKHISEKEDAMKSNIIDISLESRAISESGKAQAFWQGDFKTNREDQEIEVWVWLPLSQIEVDELKDGTCEVSLPEWLAQEKGLI